MNDMQLWKDLDQKMYDSESLLHIDYEPDLAYTLIPGLLKLGLNPNRIRLVQEMQPQMKDLGNCIMVPNCLTLRKTNTSKRTGGVYCKTSLPPNCQFGPIRGTIHPVEEMDAAILMDRSLWKHFNRRGNLIGFCKPFSVAWYHHIRWPSQGSSEVNIVACDHSDDIYLYTTKLIGVGKELILGYSDEYEHRLAVATLNLQDL